jgi:hypothetical protein
MNYHIQSPVLVTEIEPAHEPLVVTSAEVNVSRTTSIAVLLSKYWVAGQSIVEFAVRLQQSLEPFILYVNCFVKVDELPHGSVAVQVLVTEPRTST